MKRIIFILAAMLTLSACSGEEPNNIAYVCALGIDAGSDGGYDMTVQFAKPIFISGGASEEGGSGGEEIIENISVRTDDIYSAIEAANSVVSKKFSLAHTEIIVFSRETAEKGIASLMESFAKNEELRPDVLVAVAQGRAADYLENISPLVELNPTKYYQLIYETNNFGTIPKTDALEVYFNLSSGLRDSVMPLAGVAETGKKPSSSKESGSGGGGGENGETDVFEMQSKIDEDADENEGGFQYGTKNYKAGELVAVDTDKSEALGMAVFNGETLAAELGETDAELYNILNGSFKSGYASFKTDGGAAVLRLNQYRRPSYKVDNEKKECRVRLYLNGDVYSPDGADGEIKSVCENIMNAECEDFMRRMRSEYGADVIGWAQKAKRGFMDTDGYDAYGFKERFGDYSLKAETKIRIRPSGLTR